ncbi:NUDIX domain-containing protein [Streptacidiphilus sp. N1-10]|uniref:8-oxo-dGTP diphosphatase n=1 Tax=Streptacidiphilus jeojiensis TaxID=3229225 RepID=A0ABV6XWJ1_9ACTN
MAHHDGAAAASTTGGAGPLIVVAAAVVRAQRLLVVSKQAAPHVFYLPGGKPEAGETSAQALARELQEELGVQPVRPCFLAEVEAMAALERVPMKMTVFTAGIGRPPRPAAELADMVSPSNPENDWVGKVRDYPLMGIPLYLLIDARQKTVTLFSRPDGTRYHRREDVEFGEGIRIPEPFGFDLDTSGLLPYS